MKQCQYCAKEISYHQIYCSKECEQLSEEYYHRRVKFQKLISICYITGTVALALAIFIFPLVNIAGAALGIYGGFATGLITLFIPTATDNIIQKYKIKKSMTIVRVFGLVLVAVGIAATVLLFNVIF